MLRLPEPVHGSDDHTLLQECLADAYTSSCENEVRVRRPGLEPHLSELSREVFDTRLVSFEGPSDMLFIIECRERSDLCQSIDIEGMASAFEVDTSNGPGALTCPTDCGCGEPFPTPPSSLPPNLSVVARSTGIVPGTGETTFQGEINYYDHPGGGHVLSIGSITAGGSLVIDAVLQQMLRNSLRPSRSPVPAMSPLARSVLAVALGLSVWAVLWARPAKLGVS